MSILEIVVQMLLTVVVPAILLWYFYYLHCTKYWKKKGVPTYPHQFPAGNITKAVLGQENIYLTMAEISREMKKKDEKHVGVYFFNGPVYIPVDRELVKAILITDFDYFHDRGVFLDQENYPLSGHLFSLEGPQWKTLRAKLTPTFSSGKLKKMYDIFINTAEILINTLEPKAEAKEEVNIKNIVTYFSTDLILLTAFGLEGQTLKNPNNDLSRTVLTFFKPPIWEFFKVMVTEGLSKPGNILKAIMANKNHEKFIIDLVKKTVDYRDKHNIARNDFLSLLLDVRDKEGLSLNEMAAQCFVFLFAGFETSSQTVALCIHSLAYNQQLQDRLRADIFEKMGRDFRKFSYEDVQSLPFLDMCFKETLRIYPALGFLHRMCVKPYHVPGTEVVLDVGTPVLIPTLALHRDPEFFREPLKFNPDRFGAEEEVLSCSFLPFGEGPRYCIASRYGKLQSKLAIASLISKFRFYPSDRTPEVVEYDTFVNSPSMTPRKGVTVKIVPLDT